MSKADDRSTAIRRYYWQYEVKRTRVALTSRDCTAPLDAQQLSTAAVVANSFRTIVGDPPREHFLAFYLDAANLIMGYETIAIGGCTSVAVEPAQVFRGALLAGAVRLIVAHNHPSNDPTPSGSDIAMTRRLLQAADLIGIPLLDHVVVTTRAAHSIMITSSL
jgi:DNA repair protein RadC